MADTFDENAGTNKLANVLSQRMKRETDDSLILDFGEIQSNGSLITNTFPVSISKGEYSVCKHVTEYSTTADISENGGAATLSSLKVHNALKSGDRVLVAWVNSEAVVIDRITSS